MSELAPDIRLSQSHRLLDPMYVSVSGTTLPSVVRSAIPGWPCSRGVLLRLLPAGLSPRAFSQYLLTYGSWHIWNLISSLRAMTIYGLR
jgi:hypothetical protein